MLLSKVMFHWSINVKSTALCRSQPLLHYLPTTSHIKKLNTFFNKMFNALIKSNFSFLHVNLSLSTHTGCFLDTRQVRDCVGWGYVTCMMILLSSTLSWPRPSFMACIFSRASFRVASSVLALLISSSNSAFWSSAFDRASPEERKQNHFILRK